MTSPLPIRKSRDSPPVKRLLSISEAATYCCVGVTTFNAEVRPRVPPIKIGKRRVWDKVALNRWIDAQSGSEATSGDDFGDWEKEQAEGV